MQGSSVSVGKNKPFIEFIHNNYHMIMLAARLFTLR